MTAPLVGAVHEARVAAATGGVPGAARVCVIIPCYNQAHFLGEAIESALAQSHLPAEVIVVDDGSSDHTAEVAAAYPGVRCVRQPNQGLSAARNTGMRESESEYLVFLDADDRLLPDALRTGLDALRAEPAAALVSGHYRFVRSDGSLLREHPPLHPDGDHFRAFLRGNYIGMHATVMYRRGMLESVGGFDPSLRACEDYDLYLRLSRCFPVCRHPALVAEYRRHDSNMSSNVGMMRDTVLAVLRRQEEHTRGDPLREEAFRAGIAGWRRHYGRQQVLQLLHGERPLHDPREVMQGIRALVRYGPGWVGEALLDRIRVARGRLGRLSLPAGLRATRRWLRGAPPVSGVDFGHLRRRTPISGHFGYDRGLPIDRHYVEAFLSRNAAAIRGRVLEIGDNAYTRRFGGDRVTRSDVLHVSEGNPQATIVGDLASADHIPSDAFDCIVLTQTLQMIYDVRAALATLHRILRPGGVLLATFPGISQIDRGEWGDTWFWGFTRTSAKRLFEEVFPASAVTLETHGNVLAAVGFLHGLAAEELTREELEHTDPYYQLLIAVRAVKPVAR